jgi:hypothetical protein
MQPTPDFNPVAAKKLLREGRSSDWLKSKNPACA